MKGKKHLTLPKVIIVGIAQMFALIPGISRSGTTISTSLLAGIKKDEAVDFSLMLAIPAICGALVHQIIFSDGLQIMFSGEIIVAFIGAIIAGYSALHILVKKIKTGQFSDYWQYCLILGIIMLFN